MSPDLHQIDWTQCKVFFLKYMYMCFEIMKPYQAQESNGNEWWWGWALCQFAVEGWPLQDASMPFSDTVHWKLTLKHLSGVMCFNRTHLTAYSRWSRTLRTWWSTWKKGRRLKNTLLWDKRNHVCHISESFHSITVCDLPSSCLHQTSVEFGGEGDMWSFPPFLARFAGAVKWMQCSCKKVYPLAEGVSRREQSLHVLQVCLPYSQPLSYGGPKIKFTLE